MPGTLVSPAQARLWEYVETSPIHGLSFIVAARGNNVSLASWTTFTVTICFLSIYYTIGLCTYYFSEPTAIAIAATSNLSNIVFPSAAVCIELDFIGYVGATLGDVTETAFNQTIADFTASGSLALLQTVNSSAPMPALSATICASAYALIALAMDFDRGQPSSMNQLNAALPGVLPLLDIFEAYLDENNVSYSALAQVVGANMAQAMGLSSQNDEAEAGGDTTTFYFNTSDSIVWLGAPGYVPHPHVVCARLVNQTVFQDNVYGFLLVTGNTAGLYNVSASPQLRLYFDPNGGKSTRDVFSFEFLTIAPLGLSANAGIMATGRYIWLNRSASPCSNVDPFTCAERALFAQIVASRQCHSLMEFNRTAVPTCTRRFSTGEAANASVEGALSAWQATLAACPRQCDYTRFESKPTGEFGNTGIIIPLSLYPTSWIFFTNTEYYLLDGQGLLNAFGGLIGWWTGGSIVALVHILVVFLTMLVDAILNRLADSSTSTTTPDHNPLGCKPAVFQHIIVKYCREMCYITDFHGFPFLAKATNAVRALVWLIVLPLAVALTIQQTGLLVAQYNSEPVETAVASQLNTTLAFDDAAVCVQFYRNAINVTPAAIEAYNATLNAFKGSTGMTFLAQIPAVVDGAMLAALDADVMLLSHLMITAFIDYDTNEPMATPAAYGTQATLDMIDVLEDALAENGVDFFQLVKLDAAFLCDVIFQIRIVYNAYDSATSSFIPYTFNPCYDLSMFTWISDYPVASSSNDALDYVCVKLPSNLTTFSTPLDYLTIQTQAGGPMTFLIILDLRHGAGAMDSPSYDSAVYGSVGLNLRTAISVLSESRQVNGASTPCGDDIIFDCAVACFLANVSATRGCWSLIDLSGAQRPAGMPPCLEHYGFAEAETLIAETTQNVSVFAQCEAVKCLPPCVSRGYYYTIRSITVAQGGYVGQVEMHQNTFSYPLYKSAPLMDVWAALWQFGGIMSLWIGGSVIAMTHILLFPIVAIFRHWWGKSEHELSWFLTHRKPRHDVAGSMKGDDYSPTTLTIKLPKASSQCRKCGRYYSLLRGECRCKYF